MRKNVAGIAQKLYYITAKAGQRHQYRIDALGKKHENRQTKRGENAEKWEYKKGASLFGKLCYNEGKKKKSNVILGGSYNDQSYQSKKHRRHPED